MRKKIAFTSILIGILFFLNSSQYLSWFYILGQCNDGNYVDFIGQFLGKIFQALGILLFCGYAYFVKKKPSKIIEFSILIAVNFLLTVVTIIPLFRDGIVVTGLLMNIAIGLLYAWYVTIIVDIIDKNNYGLTFGAGIALSCVFSYILYFFDKDYSFITSIQCLYLYALISIGATVLYVLTLYSYINTTRLVEQSSTYKVTSPFGKNYILIIFSALLFASIVNGLGFFQPSSDISSFHISVEAMRLFYTLSLVIAGILNDKSRGLGFILCLVALSFAFALPIMHDNTTGVYVTWVLTYVFIGFISVCRTVIFLDIANENDKYYLAPIGLFIGRAGEPIGMQFRFWLANNNALLLVVISILFAVTIVLFAIPFTQFYGVNTHSDEEIDYHGVFIDRYQLSSREVQILDELLSGNANKEIAANLYITESTVKFHVKNLMKKTNCKNRNELIKLYNTENKKPASR